MKELLYVKWLDACGGREDWTPLQGEKFELSICESVGWLVHEDEHSLTIVAHRHDRSDEIETRDWHFLGDMTIPKAMVQERYALNKSIGTVGTPTHRE